jgi:hypothetical protein
MDTARLTTALGDRYRIERELGAGGMATVYLAQDLKHDRQVALKVLRPELGAVLGSDRFLAEIKITARLDHPHILTLIDSGATDGLFFYVLPFVRGESLRDKLNREKQLGLEEALRITTQVASALDYAHRQGVVHRDIKPENILIQEGEAMLADFGIALAVKEAGGNRLTETGLSLGTPQYMSPEQATGDRTLDARSDVYSLAAVLYEMLAGEPPVTGPNAQAMIAKLMTERPTKLRVVRDTVPEGIETAVAKALAKTPADRFAGAGEFARALAVLPSRGSGQGAMPARSRGLALALGTVGVVAVVALAVLFGTGKFGRRGPAYVLRDRTQLTTSGNVQASAISPDGKQLAFFSKHCAEGRCEYSVELQDVGGTATRTILDHATSWGGLQWSPDRRNLIMNGTIQGRWGTYLLSALGGPPRYLGSGAVDFWAGGDSLLIGPSWNHPDSVYYLRVTSLVGGGRDSIRVAGPGTAVAGLTVSPNGKWIIPLVRQAGHGFWQVIDRAGKIADRIVNSCTCPGQATTDALWLVRATGGSTAIVRMGLDQASGRLAAREDTVFSGALVGFTVTADGSALVIDDGTNEYSVWALPLADALRGVFPESRRVIRSSTFVNAAVSPDGRRLLVRRTMPSTAGGTELRLSIMPFDGGAETPLSTQGTPTGGGWWDSTHVMVGTLTAKGLHLVLIDALTGAAGRFVDLDSNTIDFEPLADGWAWIPAGGDRVVIQRGGRTVEIARPAWFTTLGGLTRDPAGHRLMATGWNAGSADTLGVVVFPLDGGPPVIWARMFAEGGGARFAADGSVVFSVQPILESWALYRLRGPGQVERIGTVPRPISSVGLSRDGRRASILEQTFHGDAWLNRVVRP